MSAIGNLTAKPFTAPTQGGDSSAISKLVSKPSVPVASKSSGISALTAKPFTPPVQSSPEDKSPYFQGFEPSGSFLGIADTKDPYSGRPYFAYRTKGATATTTDMTRTASKTNPEVAAPQSRDAFTNERLPESASHDIRTEQGATADQQLDHRMALALGGSNNNKNLKLIPTTENQAAGKNEGALANDVKNGVKSLFEAQNQEAASKGLPKPFTDDQIDKGSVLDDILHPKDDSTLGIIKNTIFGLPKATLDVAKSIARAAPRGAGTIFATGESLAAKQPITVTPHTALQKFLMGDEPIHDVYTRGQDSLKSIGAPDKFAHQYGLPVGMALTALDILPSSPEASAVETIAKSKSASQIINVLTKHFPDMQIGVEPLAHALQSVTDPKEVTRLIEETRKNALLSVIDDHMAAEVAPPELVKQYRETNGNIINTDNARELFPEYQADRTKSADVHERASAIAKAAYNDMLETEKGKANNTVLFTAGGTGAGKSSSLKHFGDSTDKYAIVYDTNMNKFESAASKIDKALANGYDVKISYTYGDIEQSFERAIDRTARMEKDLGSGRTVPIHEHIETHIGSQEVAPKLLAKYKDNPKVTFRSVDNSGEKAAPVENLVDFLKEKGYNGANGKDRAQLETRLQGRLDAAHNGGRISAAGKAGFEQRGVGTTSGHNATHDGGRLESLPGNGGLASDHLTSNNVGALTALADQQKTAQDFYLALSADEKDRVKFLTHISDEKTAATAYFDRVKMYYDKRGRVPEPKAPLTQQSKTPETSAKGTEGMRISQLLEKRQQELQRQAKETAKAPGSQKDEVLYHSTPLHKSITENNGGVKPPESKGYLVVPEIDWTKSTDKAAIRLSTDTMERNVEKIFPRPVADKINAFLIEPVRANETKRVQWVTKLRADIKKDVVDNLGISPRSTDSALLQQFGEGRISLDELKKASPKNWENIQKASSYFREKYDALLKEWNQTRAEAGLKPIGRLQNYFRHFLDLNTFASRFGLDFSQQQLPTAISGITEFFRSQTPWASAAMRRLGHVTTDDAVKGMDDYLDNTSKAIFHTDSVQRGRLLEKYLRDSAEANPYDIKLPNFASNLNDWTNMVSGKQARLDRAVESVVGRPALTFMRRLTRQFGMNVIGGNVSAAVTHAIPFVFTLATVDKGAAFQGLTDVLRAPWLADFNKIDGITSSFLTRRYGSKAIDPTLGEKVGSALSMPFHWVDQFISRFAVSAKYMEKLNDGMEPGAAMREADNYAARVIGDRSTGNLPNLMNTKTLGWLTQFQIEVNDNLHVLLHDVPRWEQGNVVKIAGRFAQFMVYSYMFNQAMQHIKGSGKGLDPIDLGLTLAGLNDEGGDKTVMERLQAVGGDLLKELPFTSLPTSGQVPALQPLTDAVKQAQSGNPLKALQGVLASFASPIGGGIQAQKTMTGIQAWRQGYVTDANGKITATVPHNAPTLFQGVLFGKNAFPDVKKSKVEIAHLDTLIKAQQAVGKDKNLQAANIWTQLQGMEPADAKSQLAQIAEQDPDMAKRVISAAKNVAQGLTKQDLLVRTLGIASGVRAQYIADQLQSMKNDDEKKQFLLDLANKKLLTAEVLQQVVHLVKP